MRVLFTSMSGIGHLQPMLPLALELAGRGHRLCWATAPDAHPLLARHDIPALAVGAPLGACLAETMSRFPEVGELRGDAIAEFLYPRLFGVVAAGHAFDDMARAFVQFQPDVVVNDASELTAPLLASCRDVPHATHGFGVPLPRSRVQSGGEMMAGYWRREGGEVRPYAACYEHLYIDIYPPELSAAELDHMPRVVRSRPQSASAAPGERPPREIAGDDRLVYLTFGTVFNHNPVFAEAVHGASFAGHRVVVTVGPNGDPSALGPLPAGVHVARFIPQSLLFGRCAVVISHGGSGTVLGALAAGIPQLCLPQGADQFLNSGAVSRFGAGLQLLPGEVDSGAVEAAVRRLLDESAFTEAAARAAAAIAAMPGVDAVADAVELLVTA